MDLQLVSIKVKELETTMNELQSVKSKDMDTFRNESEAVKDRHAQLERNYDQKEDDSVILSQPIVFDPLEHDPKVSSYYQTNIIAKVVRYM